MNVRNIIIMLGRALRYFVGFVGRLFLNIAKFSHLYTKKIVLFIHHHTAKRPHLFFMERVEWYKNWHTWQHHGKLHFSVLAIYVLAVFGVLFTSYRVAFAADLNNTWDFLTPSDYSFDDNLETSGSSVRMKAQNYTSDANTMALFHLDELGGTTADDSSANNNDAITNNTPIWATGNLNNSLSLDGTSQYAISPDSASLSLTASNTLEGWTKFDSNFSAGSSQYRQTILDKGEYQLYYDNETGKVTYELENSGSTGWTQQAGYNMLANNGAKVNRSWDQNGKQTAYASVKMGSKIYAALGGSTNDAEIWEYDTSLGLWAQVAGDGIFSSWNNEISTNAYEAVLSLATNGTDVLYAGLGTGTNDGDVWRFKSGSWTKIGGDGLNSGWAGNAFNGVYSLAVSGTTLFAGLGTGANMGEVWACTNCETSPSWGSSRVGGYNATGGARGWGAGYEVVYAMTVVGGNPVVGLGSTAGDAEVWHCTASCTTPGSASWTKRGGDGSGAGGQSWGSVAEYVLSMASNGNTIYVGTGITANTDAEIWSCDVTINCTPTGSGWTKLGSSANFGVDKEGIFSITNNGSTLYVGTGNSANGDDEVWRYDGSWTKVGGDNVNSGWNATHNSIRALVVDDTTVYAGLTNTTEAYFWQCTNCNGGSPTWGGNRIGGKYVNKSWGQYNIDSIESSTTAGGKMYVGTGNNTAGDATVWELDPSTGFWSVVGGQGIDSSWAIDTYEAVWSMVNYKNKLYVGLGSTAGEAEVWRFDNPGWTKVADGSPSVGSSWSTTYEYVYSLGVANGKLYAGLGSSAGDGEVWECTGCDGGSPNWGGAAIGGTASGNWGTASYTTISSMATYRGSLYVGLGANAAGLAEVWRYSGSGTTWTKVGGDAINSSWANTKYEDIQSLVVWNDKLVVGLGLSGTGTPNNDAEVWACSDCDSGSPVWEQIGGDSNGSDNMGWLDSNNYDRVRSMATYNGDLYAGLGLSTGDGEVWRYNGTSWAQVGGDGFNDSWLDTTIEEVTTMVVYQGKLYASTGNTANGDAMIWSYGNNGFIQSSTSTQDTNWHHIAGRYNGTTMEILIDGNSVGTHNTSLTIPDGDQDLLIGKSYGGFDNGRSQGFFEGSLDEIRISNINRSSFNTKPYSNAALSISLNEPVRQSGVWHWDSFDADETLNGGTILYRLSSDDGATWKYWDGDSWETSGSIAEANNKTTISTNISSFPVTFNGLRWEAILQGDGSQRVTLNGVTATATSDIIDPSANATSIAALKANGGSVLNSGAWSNGLSPYFSWTAGVDSESGIKGYCLYLGTDDTADPVTTKGLLGTSPVETGGHCQFMISTNNIDTATAGYIATPLSTSNSNYYLLAKAIDNAGNISNTTEQFTFKFDNTAPTNPAYITAPSGFINSKEVTLTWPTTGISSPSDINSGLVGLQYRIGAGNWYGDSHTGTGDSNDVLANDGSYTTIPTPDFVDLEEGINTVYFRTWDNAGNVSSTYATAALKINTSGAPSEPLNIIASPSSNVTNSFAFDWDAPATFVGDVNNLTYCYTINAIPTSINCNFTSAGVTALGAGPYATQPGENTIYVVARDESSNINYDNYGTAVFTANTPSPGISENLDIVDVSIKATNNWRLAITWNEPADVGAGISSYKVYRSTDNATFSQVGSSSSTTYIDAGLAQQRYYYRLRACDSTNNCGANSSVVNEVPTGKFTSPATLVANPEVSNITTKRATVSWSTDRASDSKIALGTASGEYSPSEVAISAQVSAHEIELDNLSAGTTYYAIAKWTDEDGNTGTSQEFSFTTSPAPSLKEITVSRVGLTTAAITFTSKEATKVSILYGKGENYGGITTVNTSLSESTYSIELEGLDDGTKYFYKLLTFDNENSSYESSVFSFTTPQRPRITDLRFQPIIGEPTSTQTVTWTTNVPANSLVTYGKVGTSGTEAQVLDLVTDHEIIIRNLEDDSEYFLVAQSRDEGGNIAVSDRQQFHTALDTRPPKVSEISIESAIRGTGAEARGQVVVSWKTDEPATSQVGYAEGSNAANYNNKTAEDTQLTTEHIVIVSDLPTSRVYSLIPISKDRAGNTGLGATESAIVGRASDSVLTIILNTLKQVFGL